MIIHIHEPEGYLKVYTPVDWYQGLGKRLYARQVGNPTTRLPRTYQLLSVQGVNVSCGLGSGDRDPAYAFAICKGKYNQILGAYPIPLLRHPSALTAIVLGTTLYLHASRDLMGYGSWEQTLFYIPSGHCWVRVYGWVYPAPALLWVLPQNYGRRAAPLQVSCFSNYISELLCGLASLLLHLNYDHWDSLASVVFVCRPWWVWWRGRRFPKATLLYQVSLRMLEMLSLIKRRHEGGLWTRGWLL